MIGQQRGCMMFPSRAFYILIVTSRYEHYVFSYVVKWRYNVFLLYIYLLLFVAFSSCNKRRSYTIEHSIVVPLYVDRCYLHSYKHHSSSAVS